MSVLPTEVTELPRPLPDAAAPNPATTPRRPPRTPLRAAASLLLLALPVLTAAHHARPAPYGDHLTVHARVPHTTPPQPRSHPPAPAHLRTHTTAIEAHDPRTGVPLWRYAREGRRPLASLHARVEVITLWDDGMVTDTDGRSVRWHRALPAARAWLAAHGGAGVLRPLGRGILAVVTPGRVSAYRIADGDLRWMLPAREGCAFEAARAVRHGEALLIAQPCRPDVAWTAQVIALDDLGRITSQRKPLGNEAGTAGRGARLEHADPEKVVARPR